MSLLRGDKPLVIQTVAGGDFYTASDFILDGGDASSTTGIWRIGAYLIHGMDAVLRHFRLWSRGAKALLQEKELVLPITTTPGEKVWFPEAVVPVAAPSRAQEQEEVPSGSMQMVISILQAVHCSQLEEKDEAMKIQQLPGGGGSGGAIHIYAGKYI